MWVNTDIFKAGIGKGIFPLPKFSSVIKYIRNETNSKSSFYKTTTLITDITDGFVWMLNPSRCGATRTPDIQSRGNSTDYLLITKWKRYPSNEEMWQMCLHQEIQFKKNIRRDNLMSHLILFISKTHYLGAVLSNVLKVKSTHDTSIRDDQRQRYFSEQLSSLVPFSSKCSDS